MTARSECVLLVVFAVFALGCDEPKPRSPEQELADAVAGHERGLDESIAALSSGSVEQRGSAAGDIAYVCCDLTPDDWQVGRSRVRPRACRALAQLLETERDPEVLARVLTRETPSCHAVIPTQTILDLCRLGCTPRVRTMVHDWLAGVDPSPELVRAILAQLHSPPDGVDPHAYASAFTRALWKFGEADLAPVVELMSDPDPFVRDIAVTTFSHALGRGPLDLPEALEALERVAKDPNEDEVLASYAEVIAASYRRMLRESPNATVVRFIEDGDLDYGEIRMLATRRFSCKAISAVPVLELFAGGWMSPRDVENKARYGYVNPQTAIAAKRALEIRAKRCGR